MQPVLSFQNYFPLSLLADVTTYVGNPPFLTMTPARRRFETSMFFMIIDDKRPLKEITHHPQHSSYLSSIVHIPSSYSQNNHHMTSQYLKNNPIKPFFFAFCFSIITMYQKYIQLKLYSDHIIPHVLLKI